MIRAEGRKQDQAAHFCSGMLIFRKLKRQIADEFRRHQYVLENAYLEFAVAAG